MLSRKLLTVLGVLAFAMMLAPGTQSAFGAASAITAYGPELSSTSFNPTANAGIWLGFTVNDPDNGAGAVTITPATSRVRLYTAGGPAMTLTLSSLTALGGTNLVRQAGVTTHTAHARCRIPSDTQLGGLAWTGCAFHLNGVDATGAAFDLYLGDGATIGAAQGGAWPASVIQRSSAYNGPTITDVKMDATSVNSSALFWVFSNAKIWNAAAVSTTTDYQMTDQLDSRNVVWQASGNQSAGLAISNNAVTPTTESVVRIAYGAAGAKNSVATDTQMRITRGIGQVWQDETITDYVGNPISDATYTPQIKTLTLNNVYATGAGSLALMFSSPIAAVGASAWDRVIVSYTDSTATTRYGRVTGLAINGTDASRVDATLANAAPSVYESAVAYSVRSAVTNTCAIGANATMFVQPGGASWTAADRAISVQVLNDTGWQALFGTNPAVTMTAAGAITDVLGTTQNDANFNSTTVHTPRDAIAPTWTNSAYVHLLTTVDANRDGTVEAVLMRNGYAMYGTMYYEGLASPASTGGWAMTSTPATVQTLLGLAAAPNAVTVPLTVTAVTTTVAFDSLLFTIGASDWGTGATLVGDNLQDVLNTGITNTVATCPFDLDYLPADAAAATFDRDGYDLSLANPTAGSLMVGAVTNRRPGDDAGPVLVGIDFLTGDNIAGPGFLGTAQSMIEQDNVPQDQATNNRCVIKWSEGVVLTPTAVLANFLSFDTTPYDNANWAALNLGSDHVISANGAGTAILPTAAVNILPGYGVDAYGNRVSTVTAARMTDISSPYIEVGNPLVLGTYTPQCFLINPSARGGYSDIYVKFNEGVVVTSTPSATDWVLNGTTVAPSTAAVAGSSLLLGLSDTLAWNSALTLVYTQNSNADVQLRDTDMYEVPSGQVPVSVPTVGVNTNDIRVMDVSGTITNDDRNPAPPMTIVQGYVMQRQAVRGFMIYQGAKIPLSSSDLSALNNVIGRVRSGGQLIELVYAHTCNALGLVELSNSPNRRLGAATESEEDHIIGLVLRVNVQIRKVTFSGAANVPGVGFLSISGEAALDWVARSPSLTAIDNNTGQYLLHVADDGALIGNPVILQVNLPDGDMWLGTGIVDGASPTQGNSGVLNSGKLLFLPINDPSRPTRVPDGRGGTTELTSNPAQWMYDIDLSSRVQLVEPASGRSVNDNRWNIIPVLKDGAYYTVGVGNLPVVPQNLGADNVRKIPVERISDCFVAISSAGAPLVGTQVIEDLLVITNRGLEYEALRGSAPSRVPHVVGAYAYVAYVNTSAGGDPMVFFFGTDLQGSTLALSRTRQNLGWYTLSNYNQYDWSTMSLISDYAIHYDVDDLGARSTNFSSATYPLAGDLFTLRNTDGYFVHMQSNTASY